MAIMLLAILAISLTACDADNGLADFYFDLSYNGLVIIGVKDKTATSIVIPDNVVSIRSGAFSGCSNLTSITIPSSVTTIGTFYAFNLTDVYYLGTLEQWCNITLDSSYRCFGSNLHIDGELLTGELIIPDGVTRIGDYAFFDCDNLTSITIPDSVRSIGERAFYTCDSLTSITIPSNVTTIGNMAFDQCRNLTNVYYGGTEIEWTKITIDSHNTSLTDATRYYYSECIHNEGSDQWRYDSDGNISTELTVGDWIVDIEATCKTKGRRHKECTVCHTTLETEVTPAGHISGEAVIENIVNVACTTDGSYDTVVYCTTCGEEISRETIITDYATGHNFKNNKNCSVCSAEYYTEGLQFSLSSDEYTVTGISTSATEIVIPSVYQGLPVVAIASRAFYENENILTVKIPDSVTSIGSGAFNGCSSLESITIPFVGAKAGVTSSDTYQYPFGYIFGTTSYTGGVAVKQYYYDSSTTSTTATTYYIPKSLRSVTVTGGNILYRAFGNCSMLTSITIPDSVKNIGEYAFDGCTSLTSITIPDSVTTIGSSAFGDCTSLTSITIPSRVTRIGSYAFFRCISLTSITFGYNSQLTRIDSGVFQGCDSLKSITIPSRVTHIGMNAFMGCSSLTSIKFTDTTTWYIVTSYGSWENKTYGTKTSVTNTSTNATYFTSTYVHHYWYKL